VPRVGGFLDGGGDPACQRFGWHTPRAAKVGTARFLREYQHLQTLAPALAAVGDRALIGIATSMNNIDSAMHSDLTVRES
jgi:hypothetical protein